MNSIDFKTPNTGVTDIKDGENPFYTKDDTPDISYTSVPFGPSSGFDTDTIQGLQAVTAKVAGPNKLVATGSDGKLPASILPASGVVAVTGTYAAIILTNPSTPTFGIASTPGAGTTLLFYCGISTVGANGWLLLAGS